MHFNMQRVHIAAVNREVIDIRLPSLKLMARYNATYVDDNLNKLSRDLSNILYGTPVSLSYSELYNLADGLCQLKKDEQVRENLEHLVEHYVCIQVLGLDMVTEDDFLELMLQLWLAFQRKVALIRNIYLPLEAAISKHQRRKYGVSQMAYDAFYRCVLQDERIHAKLAYVYEMLNQVRDKRKINVPLLKGIIGMMLYLQMYDGYVELTYMKYVHVYYRQEREVYIEGGILDYFIRVQQRLHEETKVVLDFLLLKTASKVQAVIKKIFIEEALPALLSKLKERDLFTDGTPDEIMVVYDQLGYLPRANNELCRFFSKYMLAKGRSIIFDSKNEHNLISNLLEFKDRVDNIAFRCFISSHMYVDAVRMAFMKFINQRKYKPAQLLAKYIDGRMRDKLIPEDLFDKIIVLFRYIQAKDIFEAYYKRYLGKRLLLGKSSSQDAEKCMLGKLKFECGDDFTFKLEGMFKDIDLSEGLCQAFKQRGTCDAKAPELIEFSTQVLTCSFWPNFSKFKMTLPAAMLHYHTLYQEFYKGKYSGRSLEWTGSLDTCLMKAHFLTGPKEVQVSLFQAGVLLLFNDAIRISYKMMSDLLGLEDSELKRTLNSLLMSKVKILKTFKAPEPPCHSEPTDSLEPPLLKDVQNLEEGDTDTQNVDDAVDVTTVQSVTLSKVLQNEITDDDEFEINEDFHHKLFRIKVNQVQYKDTEEEQKITEDEVLHDRHLQIDAAVVRVMKQHRGLKHNELLAKLFGALKFPVNPNDIKKRIETLIERDFLARNPNDPNAYIYVA